MTKKNETTNTAASNTATNNTTSNNVVSNDKSPISYNVFSSLSNLTEQRKQWEEGAYRKSNDELYALLQHCYELDQLISTASEGVKAMRDEITKYAKQLGFSFQQGTPTITKIVRCVFGDKVKRSRISTYSIVLRTAKSKNIAAKDIPSFITKAGGVQEIRLTKSPNYQKPSEKIAAAEKTVFNTPITNLKVDELPLLDSDHVEEPCVLLARQEADGSFTVYSVVRSTAAVNAAKLGAMSAEKKAQEAQAEQDAISAEADAQADLVNETAKQVAA